MCLACEYQGMDACGKFGEHTNSVTVAWDTAEGNSSFLAFRFKWECGKLIFFWQPCVSVLLCSFSPGLPLPVFCPSLPLLCSSVIFPSFSFPPFITFPISFHPSLPPSKFFHFFYFILPSCCPLSSFCSYSPSFSLSPFSPIFSLSFSFLYFSPYPSLLSYILSLFSYPTNVTHFPSKMGISDRMVDSSQTTLVQ